MHLRSTLALAAGALLAAACQTVPQSGSPSPEPTIRVATWNLEHLAEADGAGCRPRTAAEYEALRDHAERTGAQVIALQEVENVAAARRVFPESDWTIVLSGRPPSGRSGFCRGSAGATIRHQDVGFAIRKGVRFRRNPDLTALGLGDADLRWGVDITLELERPIRLLSVHLKSGCNAGRDPADRDCEILFRQADVLERWIDQQARAGRDFAVLGDWNRRTAITGDAFIAQVSDHDPPGGMLVMADAGRRAACIARYPDFIDHIGVGERASGRVRPGSFVEYTYGDLSEDQHPADHCPSWIDLRGR